MVQNITLAFFFFLKNQYVLFLLNKLYTIVANRADMHATNCSSVHVVVHLCISVVDVVHVYIHPVDYFVSVQCFCT